MAYKIDVTIILRDHFKTIVNDNTGKPDPRDWIVFGLLPVLLPAVILYFKIFIASQFVSGIISGLSIYVGLSLNLIVLLFDSSQRDSNSFFKKEFAKELIANVCFSIILSIVSIIVALFTLGDFGIYFKFFANGICYFCLIHMLLIILMLVKRLYYQLLDQIT